MMRNKRWALFGGLILLIICMTLPSVPTMASGVAVSAKFPLIISNIQVSGITACTAAISWNTNTQDTTTVTSQVSYGVTNSYGSSVSDNSSGHHSANISGLLSGTTYYYQIQSMANIGGTAFPATYSSSFKTVAPSPITSTNIMLTSLLNTSYCGQTVYFGVSVLASGSKTIPSGTVTFYDGTASLGTSPLFFGLTGFSDDSLSVGNHNITAVYVGNNNYATSTSKVVIQKVLAKTVCTWPVKPNPCNFGQTCTFKIHIGVQSPGTGNPTGNVTFYDGPKSIGTGSWSGDTAVLNCFLSTGSHSITAKYSGDDKYDGSTSDAVNQTINKANTTITLTSSPNPSKSGNTVTFTTAVVPNTATGTVIFKDGNTTIGTGSLIGGQVTCSTKLSVGIHSIKAVYSGDSNLNGSTSNTLSQTIK